MAINILKGNFPIFYWGEAYSGTLESYLTAVFFYIFGVSSTVLRLSPALFSVLFVILTYLVARETIGKGAGLIAMAVSIFPPIDLLLWGLIAKNAYIEVYAIGLLIILLTCRIISSNRESSTVNRELFILGLLMGVAWWLHLLSVPFILTALFFVFLKDKRIFFKKEGAVFVSAILIGSAPYWIYNLTNNFRSFDLFAAGGTHSIISNIGKVVSTGLPVLMGYHVGIFTSGLFNNLYKGLWLLLFIPPLIFIILSRWKNLLSMVTLKTDKIGGIDLVFVFFLMILLVSASTHDAKIGEWKHLMTALILIPLIIAYYLEWIRKRSLTIFFILLVFFSVFNLPEEIRHIKQLKGVASSEMVKIKELLGFLKSEGISHAYAHYTTSQRVTFFSEEGVICADFFGARNPVYLREVDRSKNVAIIIDRSWPIPSEDVIEKNLPLLDMGYSKAQLSGFTVFHDFRPSRQGFYSIPPDRWKVEVSGNREISHMASDRDVLSSWSPPESITGWWYEVDLGSIFPINRITVIRGLDGWDFQEGLILEVSRDKRQWYKLAGLKDAFAGFSELRGHPKIDIIGKITATFEPIMARHVRIMPEVQGTPTPIAEVFIYSNKDIDGTRDYASATARLEKGLMADEDSGWLYTGTSPVKSNRFQIGRIDWKRIAGEYLKAIEINPELEYAHVRLGTVYRRMEIPDKPHFERGDVLSRFGIKSEAMKSFEEALSSLEGDYYYSLLERLIKGYRESGQDERAEELAKVIRHGFSPKNRVDINLGGKIIFLGYDIDKDIVKRGDAIRINYYWKGLKKMDKDYAVFVHSTSQGRIYFQNDHYPLKGRHPTSRWVKGEYVKEGYIVRIPDDIPTGEYKLIVGVWDPEKRKRLKVKGIRASGEKDSILIGTLRVME